MKKTKRVVALENSKHIVDALKCINAMYLIVELIRTVMGLVKSCRGG
jgi:hypothetical protein